MARSDRVRRFLTDTAPERDALVRDMEAHADEAGFPIIGHHAGALLRSYACATEATRVFEFGSGFGYSAYWFLRGMSAEGSVVLTEIDAEELDMAEDFLARAGMRDRAVLEHGDALSIVEENSGPFDIVLIDHRKDQYPDAFDAVRPKLPVGSVVIADNIMRDSVVDVVSGDGSHPGDDRTRGIVEYLDTVRGDPDFATVVLPVGSGLAVSTRERD